MNLESDVCIVGAGPAGLVLAIELGRAGKMVTVLESTVEFERHFRGESIVPDAVWLLRQMGLLEALERKGVKRSTRFDLFENGNQLLSVDFESFGQLENHPIEIPQTMLLERMLEECEALPTVNVVRGIEAQGLIRRNGRFREILCTTKDRSNVTICAKLIVGADGRYSKIRDLAELPFDKVPLARDVIWFRVSNPDGWDREVYRVMMKDDQHVIVLPTFPEMLRVGLNIPKGGFAQIRALGIEELHSRVSAIAPALGERVAAEIREWTDTMVLDIFTTQVASWHADGVVLIGDAAHTLSPVLGHGVNHAIQDGRALAIRLAELDFEDAGFERQLPGILDAFQTEREPLVEQSRALQLRQEKLFSMSGGARTLVRRVLYRSIGAVGSIRRSVFRKAYFSIEQK